MAQPEGSMNQHPHRSSDPAAISADATIGPALVGMLREHSALGDLELNGSSSNTGPEKLEPQGTRKKGRLSDKYLAGLLDSDGSILLLWHPPMEGGKRDRTQAQQRAYVVVSFSQSTPDKSFMELIARSLTPPSAKESWGYVGTRAGTNQYHWATNGARAVSVLMRLRKFLVLKRALADCAIGMNGKVMNVEEASRQFDAARSASPMPKHPTRKWTAGYIDGNGCFKADVQVGMAATITLSITDETKERVGADLLHKAYGGSVQEYISKHGTPMVQWVLVMDAAKFRSIFESEKGGVGKHMVLKTDQVYFLLGCAKLGHFRDGARIKSCLEQLRARLHRLSGPGAQVAEFLKTIRDVPLFKGPGAAERKRQWDEANP